MNKIKTTKLKRVLDAMFKNNRVKINIMSIDKPEQGKLGCFIGLVSLANLNLEGKYKMNYDCKTYSFTTWARIFAEYIGFKNAVCLKNWAKENPKLWGNSHGFSMFTSLNAYGFPSYYTENIKSKYVLNHWYDVLSRVKQAKQIINNRSV